MFNKEILDKLFPIIYDIKWNIEIGKRLFYNEDGIDFKELINFDDLTLETFFSRYLIDEEIGKLLNLIKKARKITNEKSINIIIRDIYNFYKIGMVSSIFEKYKDATSVDRIIKEINNINIEISPKIEISNMATLKPSLLIENSNNYQVLPSNLNLIKDNLFNKGYLVGEIEQFAAAPGKGKSALMNYELSNIARLGFKVLLVSLGDLDKFDLICRLSSAILDVEYVKILASPDKYFEKIKDVANNIDIVTERAGEVTSENLIEISKLKPYDLVVVDYDSQIKQDNIDNMYQQGGKLYEDLMKIAKDEEKRKVVFVGSQISKFYWNYEIVPEESIGESSRKQHHVDNIITIGRSVSDYHCGFLHLAKARRGKDSITVPYMMNESGIFKEITTDYLNKLRKFDGNSSNKKQKVYAK